MSKRNIIIIGSVAGVLLIAIIAYFLFSGKEKIRGGPGDEGGVFENENFPQSFPDAPDPTTDPEIAEQVRNLWPHVFAPRVDREEVAQQWKDFAKQYPDNIYIPEEFRSPISDAEKSKRRETLDAIGSVESKIAASKAQAESAKPGQNGPNAPAVPSVTPEEQRLYFNYRISELQSRIQLVQYLLSNGQPDAAQRASAEKEIQGWNKELSDYQNLLKQLPR